MSVYDPDLQIPYTVAVYTTSAAAAPGMILSLASDPTRLGAFTGILPLTAQPAAADTPGGALALVDGDQVWVEYADRKPAAQVVVTRGVPRVRFIDPSPAPSAIFTSAEGCAFQLTLRAADTQPAALALPGAGVVVRPTRYRAAAAGSANWGSYSPGLPVGASFVLDAAWAATAVRSYSGTLGWRPRSDQAGTRVEMCFEAAEARGAVAAPAGGESTLCLIVEAARCRRCAAHGDNLFGLAAALGNSRCVPSLSIFFRALSLDHHAFPSITVSLHPCAPSSSSGMPSITIFSISLFVLYIHDPNKNKSV